MYSCKAVAGAAARRVQDATMSRKDCDNLSISCVCKRVGRSTRWEFPAIVITLTVGLMPVVSSAGTVRLWPSAVVVDDSVRLSDLAELRAFDAETERKLGQLVVTDAPAPGGSRIVHLEMVRSVLARNGANMATVTLRGATQCALSRPADLALHSVQADATLSIDDFRSGSNVSTSESPTGAADSVDGLANSGRSTLRQAVINHFHAELTRFGGRADVVFDRTSDQVLALSGPTYQFRVRRHGGPQLGLIQLEVDVLADGRVVQAVPLVAQVSMVRRVVIARRAVNQDATVKASDVELVPVSFTRLEKLGMDDPVQAVGQRAKRFIAAGSVLDSTVLESVPLVMRGQLVTLTSVSGAVKVVTTAKATQDGLLGETIKVRAADNRRIELDTVVVGPGAVQIGSGLAGRHITRIARGDQP